MTTLAQAYIHLKPYSASEREIHSLGRYAQRIAAQAAIEIYGGGVEIDVQIEEGSLVTRVTVVGALLLAVHSHVADYKGFRESIVEICEDAKEFAVDVCSPFVKKAGVSKEDVYRFERRLKTPGKLLRISKRLDKLQNSVNELSPRALQKELANLRVELDSVAEDISESERATVESALKRPKLPPPAQWPVPDQPKVGVRRDEDFEQSIMFDDVSGTIDPPHKRRVVFKAKTSVPRKKRKRTNKKKAKGNPDLLSSN